MFILVNSKLHWNLSLFWSNGYIVWSIFPLLLQASTGHLSHGFFHHALGVHELSHTHSLASLQWSWLSDQQTVLPTEKCLQFQKWSPYSQPRQLPCPWHVMNTPAHIPLPPLLLTQNLSTKWIAPTDNMWPKLHDEYTCHQLLKSC